MPHYSHRDRLTLAYDRKAAARDGCEPQDWKQDLRQQFLERLQQAGAGSLLELGPGPGRDALFFQQAGLRVTAADLSPQMARRCRGHGLDAAVMEVCRLGFPDAIFEAVYSLNCLLHLPPEDLPAALGEIQRVLKPEGLFFLGVYGGYEQAGVWEKDDYDPKRYFCFRSDESLQREVSAWFEIESFDRVAVPHDFDSHFQAVTARSK